MRTSSTTSSTKTSSPDQTIVNTKRSVFLDLYRGLAVLLMIVFHFCWDLGSFGFIEFSVHDPFWIYFRSLILTLFFTAVGWSAYVALSKAPKVEALLIRTRFGSFIKRDLKLLVAASAISLSTYIAVPDQWIYFGILHFIFVASLISRPFIKWPIPSALFGVGIVMAYHFTDWLTFPNLFYSIVDVLNLPHKTLDIVFPFPWIGVFFIGPILGYFQWHTWSVPKNSLINIVSFMGRHALLIYLSHQIVLFAFVAGLDWLFTLLS